MTGDQGEEPPMDIEITDQRTDEGTVGRYTLLIDGEEAGEVTWQTSGGRRAITHTGVRPSYRNHGLAGALLARALDDARADGVGVLPVCSYAARYIDDHPEHRDLLDRSA